MGAYENAICEEGTREELIEHLLKARSENITLTAALEEARGALEAMINEWEKMTRYGSPLAKQANENLARARTALATINAALGRTGGS